MSPRSIRRAAERQAAKLARKQPQNPKQGEGQRQPCVRTAVPGAEKHALTGNFRLLQSESQEAFDELRTLLRDEHAPTTPTESLLVDRMVEHIWLSQRAGRFQNEAARDGKESWFALMLRYQTTHDRSFHKCLAELRTMRRERARNLKQEPVEPAQQFESQKAAAAPAAAGPEFESQSPRTYTEDELARLSDGEIHSYVQAALQKANIDLSTFEDLDKQVRIAECSQ